DFSWWLPEDQDSTSKEVQLSLERANEAILPTHRIGPAVYWVDTGEKAHIRWVRPEPENDVLKALARLSARGELDLGEGSRYAGSFRAHGLLVPVWDVDREAHAREWAEPVERFGERLEQALASLSAEPLTGEERRARDGNLGRQLTLRWWGGGRWRATWGIRPSPWMPRCAGCCATATPGPATRRTAPTWCRRCWRRSVGAGTAPRARPTCRSPTCGVPWPTRTSPGGASGGGSSWSPSCRRIATPTSIRTRSSTNRCGRRYANCRRGNVR